MMEVGIASKITDIILTHYCAIITYAYRETIQTLQVSKSVC